MGIKNRLPRTGKQDVTDPGEPLDPEKILDNVRTLRERVTLRFEGHSIAKRAERLVRLAERATTRITEIARPRYTLRFFCAVNSLLLMTTVGTVLTVALQSPFHADGLSLADVIQGVESGIGCTLFLAATLLYLCTMEKRARRKEILQEIDYLRNFLHLVNMGQLDKEPTRLEQRFIHTEISPAVHMDAATMERYLSQTQKLAHYAAEIGCVYANLLVDAEVDRAAEHLREFAADVASAAGDKITVLLLRMAGNRTT